MADALICLGGCDKTVPAALMPIPRHNGIGLMLYAGRYVLPPNHPPTHFLQHPIHLGDRNIRKEGREEGTQSPTHPPTHPTQQELLYQATVPAVQTPTEEQASMPRM